MNGKGENLTGCVMELMRVKSNYNIIKEYKHQMRCRENRVNRETAKGQDQNPLG